MDALVTRAKRELLIGAAAGRGCGPSLDVGCGAGRYLRHLREPVVGVDIDRPLLARLAKEGWPVVLGDAHRLPFRDGAFRTVLFSEVLEHVPEPRKAVSEVKRVLAKGGRVVLSTPSRRYPFIWDPRNWVREHQGLPPVRRKTVFTNWTPDHKRLFTAAEVRQLLAPEIAVERLRCAGRTATPVLTAVWLPVYGTWKVAKAIGLRGLRPIYERAFQEFVRTACAEDRVSTAASPRQGSSEPCLTLIAEGRKR